MEELSLKIIALEKKVAALETKLEGRHIEIINNIGISDIDLGLLADKVAQRLLKGIPKR